MVDVRTAILCTLLLLTVAGASTQVQPWEDPDVPWVVTAPTLITEPMHVQGPIIVLTGGSLEVSGVSEPGFQMEGHLWAIGSSEVRLENSVIEFLSSYHGQYSLVAGEQARVEVSDCVYRVPAGVQHALMTAGSAEMLVHDTDFGDVQLLSAESSRLTARRLNGRFEVLVQHDSHMVVEDIPRDVDQGNLWVWVEFGPGSEAVYSPPMPGYVETWTFPPPDSTGILQTVTLSRCETLLWPMLIREDSRLTLRDIPEDHWVVVGLHLFTDAVIRDLHNDQLYLDETLALEDRELRLENASIDTWNLYPQQDATVLVSSSTLGEILAMGDARVLMWDTLIDGTGGFFGARDGSHIEADNCVFTCTIEASQDATIELHSSQVLPYPLDPDGVWTRFGAYDSGRLLADQTPVETTPALGGNGLIAVSYIANPPAIPPGPGESVELWGSAAQFSLDEDTAPGSWRLEAAAGQGMPTIIASGDGNVEEDVLGVWRDAEPWRAYQLRVVLTDRLERELSGRLSVPGSWPPPPAASAPRR
jgi:hypothetical protein